ncbi:MAG: asparagine synthase-related protein [Methanobacterium paludis]|nr:asparagine synthase-related protein [Methanobacterium paludis]
MAIMWDSYKKMEEKGIRILLGGNGGDEIISHGENYLKELAITFKWKKLMNELKSMSEHSNTSYYNLMVTYFIFPFIPEIFKNLILRRRDMFKKNGTIILNKDFVKKLGGEKYLRDLKWNSVKEVNTAKKSHYYSITSNQYVIEMLDRGTAAFSIETRHPYYDKRLVEFCYAIPDEMKFRFGWDRFIQRIAMEDILPPEIQWRNGKTNFSTFYEKNLLLFEKDSLDKIVRHDNKIIKDYIDLDMLTDLYEKYNSGNKSIGNDVFGIWLSTLLYLWLTEVDYSKS